METNTEPEKDFDGLTLSNDPAQADTTSKEPVNNIEIQKTATGKTRSLLGRVRYGLQTASNARRRGGRRNSSRLEEETPALADDSVIEPASTDDIVIDLTRWTRRLVIPLALLAWAGVVILVLWGASHIMRAILLLVISALLAYALAPLVTLLQRIMPRFLAITAVYLIVLGGVGVIVYLVVRTAVDQITSLSTNLQFLFTPVNEKNPSAVEQTLRSFKVSTDQISSIRTQVIAQTKGLAENAVPLLTGLVNTSLDVILVAVLSVYLLIDGSRVTRWFRQSMPHRQRGRVRFLLETLQRIVGGYIRGQLLLCSIIGILVGVGMGVIGVPYALLLGVLAFVLEFIPILGTLVSGAICVLLALTKGWPIALVVLVYFIVVHIIEGDIVGPRIVGKSIGLHPVVSLIALIIGGELFGIWGALFASPIAGVLQAILIALWSEWREMHPDQFQQVKNQFAENVEKNIADKSIDPEPEAKLL